MSEFSELFSVLNVAELSLEWIEAGSLKTQHIGLGQTTKQPGVTRIGRDPSRCDIVLADGSVSGLHVEIGYDSQAKSFYIHNLRESNPPIINSQLLTQGRRTLLSENIIQLGNLQLRANVVTSFTQEPQNIPPTEIQSLAAPPTGEPPKIKATHQPQPYQSAENFLSRTTQAPDYTQSQPPPLGTDNNLDKYNYNTGSVPSNNQRQGSSKSPWLMLILGGILLGLLILAWPNIRSFLGISSSTIESETSNNPVQDSGATEAFSLADRELFTHPSGLFELEIPRQWSSINNSQARKVVIQAWRHPQINAYIIMRVFRAEETLTPIELQLQGQRIVKELFSELNNFKQSAPEVLNDGSVQIFWEGAQGTESLIASTFIRQDGVNLSILTMWAPEQVTQNNVLRNDVNGILNSWNVDPNREIP